MCPNFLYMFFLLILSSNFSFPSTCALLFSLFILLPLFYLSVFSVFPTELRSHPYSLAMSLQSLLYFLPQSVQSKHILDKAIPWEASMSSFSTRLFQLFCPFFSENKSHWTPWDLLQSNHVPPSPIRFVLAYT